MRSNVMVMVFGGACCLQDVRETRSRMKQKTL